jgi:hypothetical protein
MRVMGEENRDDDVDTDVPERYQDWSAHDAASRVAERARVAYEPWMQDWPLEVSDEARLDEFLALYETATDDHERTLLMELIMFSMESAPDAGAAHWPKVAELLEQSAIIHARVLIYWSLVYERPDHTWAFADLDVHDGGFPTTPLARSVLARVREKIGFLELAPPPLDTAAGDTIVR